MNSVKKSLFQSQCLGDFNGFSGEKGATTCGKPSGAIVIRGTAVVSIRVTLASCGWKSYGHVGKSWGNVGENFLRKSSIWSCYFSLLSWWGVFWCSTVPAKSSFSGGNNCFLMTFHRSFILERGKKSSKTDLAPAPMSFTARPGQLWRRPPPPAADVQSKPPGFYLAKLVPKRPRFLGPSLVTSCQP